MVQLHQDYDKFLEQDTEVVVVGPEGPDEFKKYWQENDLPFTGLPDPTHTVLKLYGQQVNIFKFGRMPAQAVIDKSGIVRFVHYGKSMSDIPDSASLLDLLAQLEQQQVE